jgi:NADPH:quinone reductase-like Zn-dependent oxidoreductase
VLGLNMLRISEHRPELVAECLQAVVEAHARGLLRPHVHATHAAEGLPQAIAALAGGATMGKLAVRW